MCPLITWEAFIVKEPEVSNVADANVATIETNGPVDAAVIVLYYKSLYFETKYI